MTEPELPPHRHYATLGSTNDAARDWGWDGAPHLAVVTASAQTAGRGRRGRAWVSLPERGLYASFVLRPTLDKVALQYQLADVPRLTMLLALATVCVVDDLTGLCASTKWPNDVLLHERKIAGVLCEAYLTPSPASEPTPTAMRDLAFCVAGVGLNVNFLPEELPERPVFPASSLRIETGRSFEMDAVFLALRTCFALLIRRYDAGEWETLRVEWENRCAGLGQSVTIRDEQGEWSGVALMTDSEGALVVGTPQGLRRVVAGEITYSGTVAEVPLDQLPLAQTSP